MNRNQFIAPRLCVVGYILLVVTGYILPQSTSRMLDSGELLVGSWDVDLRAAISPDQLASTVFPPREQKESLEGENKEAKTRDWPRLLPQIKRKRRQPLSCQLNFFSNGTFHLTPKSVSSDHQKDRLQVRGIWKLDSNPYCVTDRFYDEIVLTSFTRIKSSEDAADQQQKQTRERQHVLAKGRLRMHCRLTGHYSAGRSRLRHYANRDYAKGSLSRGLVIWEDLEAADNSPRMPRLSLWASFTGKRWIPPLVEVHDVSE